MKPQTRNIARFALPAAALLLIGLAAAADMGPDQPPTIPQERQYDDGHCFAYEVKMLNAATVIGDPNQESYLRAADAYHRLDALGQKC